jgi:hypothetical protein
VLPPDEPLYTWRSAVIILLWCLVFVAVCAVMVLIGWWVLDYVLVPQPYHDPEPPPPSSG